MNNFLDKLPSVGKTASLIPVAYAVAQIFGSQAMAQEASGDENLANFKKCQPALAGLLDGSELARTPVICGDDKTIISGELPELEILGKKLLFDESFRSRNILSGPEELAPKFSELKLPYKVDDLGLNRLQITLAPEISSVPKSSTAKLISQTSSQKPEVDFVIGRGDLGISMSNREYLKRIQQTQAPNSTLTREDTNLLIKSPANSLIPPVISAGSSEKITNLVNYDPSQPVSNIDSTTGLPKNRDRLSVKPVQVTEIPEGLKGQAYVDALLKLAPQATAEGFRVYLANLQDATGVIPDPGLTINVKGFVAHTTSDPDPKNKLPSNLVSYFANNEEGVEVQCLISRDGIGHVLLRPDALAHHASGANSTNPGCEAIAMGIPEFNPNGYGIEITSSNGVTPQQVTAMAYHAIYTGLYSGKNADNMDEYLDNVKGHHKVAIENDYGSMERNSEGVFIGDRSDWPEPLSQEWNKQFVRPLWEELKRKGVTDKQSFIKWLQQPNYHLEGRANLVNMPRVEQSKPNTTTPTGWQNIPAFPRNDTPTQPAPDPEKLVFIPSINSVDSAGRAQIPEKPMYIDPITGEQKEIKITWYKNTPAAERCMAPQAITWVMTMAKRLQDKGMAPPIIGDADASAEEHKTHNKAVALDIPIPDSEEDALEIIRSAWESGLVYFIIHDNQRLINLTSQITGISDFMEADPKGNHPGHLHLVFNSEYESDIEQRACQPNFDYMDSSKAPFRTKSTAQSPTQAPSLIYSKQKPFAQSVINNTPPKKIEMPSISISRDNLGSLAGVNPTINLPTQIRNTIPTTPAVNLINQSPIDVGNNSDNSHQHNLSLTTDVAGSIEENNPTDYSQIPDDQEATMREAGQKYGVPVKLLAGIRWVEKGQHWGKIDDDCAVSVGSARGPWQFIDSTWAKFGVDADGDGKADPCNWQDSTFAAANYMGTYLRGKGYDGHSYIPLGSKDQFTKGHPDRLKITVLDAAVEYNAGQSYMDNGVWYRADGTVWMPRKQPEIDGYIERTSKIYNILTPTV